VDLQETLRGDVSEYRVYESIASGGFGSVYIGRDTATNVPVAVKRLHPHLKDQPGFVERFEREASTVRGLVHPNIVRVLDQGRDKYGVPFIVLEWVEGLTVGDWLKRRGPYAPAEAADVACQALEGLQAAWSRRVVHRDVKPANLMVTPTGRVKVMDFGVAKDVDLATLAGTSGVIGTPAYMAPEQLRGQPLDGRADIYAMGVTLYQMIAGSPPFMGPTMADYFRQQLQEEPPPIPGLAPALGAVIGRALEKQPEDRYTTPGDMLNALRPFAAEAGIDTSYIPRPGTTPTSSPGTFQSFPPTPYPSTPATPAPIGYSGETIRGAETFRGAERGVEQPRRGSFPIALLAVPLVGLLLVVAAGAWWFVLRPVPSPPVATPNGGLNSTPGVASTAGVPATPGGFATAPPQVAPLFRDPLDDVTSGRLQKASVEPANYLVGYGSDGYVIQKVNPAAGALVSVSVFTPAGVSYAEAVLSIDARIIAPAPNSYVALICREQDARTGYLLKVMPESGEVVIQRLDGGSSAPTPLANAVSAAVKPGNQSNHIELRCAGSSITARINDTDVATAVDGAYPSGGLRIGAGSNPGAIQTVEAHFRNLLVTRP